MDESLFDKIADAELISLERAIGDIDPDECEVESTGGVLTLSFPRGSKIVVNSHRAARQMWMAAYLPGQRQAWHFSPHPADGAWSWTVDGGERAELRATLAQLLAGQLGRAFTL